MIKTSSGFQWSQTNSLASFVNWGKDVTCNGAECSGQYLTGGNANGYGFKVIYYSDTDQPTFILYQCFDFRSALQIAMNSYGGTDFVSYLINTLYSLTFLENIHYSLMLVASQNPT